MQELERENKALIRELAEQKELIILLVKANTLLETQRRYWENDVGTYRLVIKEQDEKIATLEEERKELISVRDTYVKNYQELNSEIQRQEREIYTLKQEIPKLQGEKYFLERDNANLREISASRQNVIDKQANELLSVKELINTLKLHSQNLEAKAQQADKVIASQDKEIAEWKRLYEELLDSCETTEEERTLIKELRNED